MILVFVEHRKMSFYMYPKEKAKVNLLSCHTLHIFDCLHCKNQDTFLLKSDTNKGREKKRKRERERVMSD